MTLRVLRAYADTSVFGGPFDEELSEPSRRFFDEVRRGRFHLCTSAVVAEEIRPAPPAVRDLFHAMLAAATLIEVSPEALELRQAYLAAGIVGPGSANDALHVALATTADCDLIVSWNFRHIVHFRKIRQYNAVSVLHGFRELSICSPREVISYENEGL